jgi:hypothetical protein
MARAWTMWLAVAALAGCAAPDDADASHDAVQDGTPERAVHRLAFDLAENWTASDSFAGSVPATGTANTGAFLTGDYRHSFDVSHLVPPDVPATVVAVLSFAASQNCNFGFYVEAADATFYAYGVDGDCIRTTVTATILAAGPVAIVFEAYSPGDDVPETPFRIDVEVAAHREHVPAGVPVAVRLGPNETVSHADGSRFHVWNERDERIASAVSTFTTPRTGGTGEYVVMPLAGGSMLATDGAAQALRPLPIAITFGAGRDLSAGDAVEWTATTSTHAAGVGVWVHSGPEVALGSTVFALSALTVQARAPDGTELVSADNVCAPFCGIGGFFGAWFPSELGDEALVPGDYSFRVDNDLAVNVQAQDAFLTFAR